VYITAGTQKGEDGHAYTDGTQLPIYEAMKGPPPMLGYTQIRAQILGAEGQNGAQPGVASKGKKLAQAVVNEAVCRGLAHCGAGGDLERAKGFESCGCLFICS
jgi:hypothetical protein